MAATVVLAVLAVYTTTACDGSAPTAVTSRPATRSQPPTGPAVVSVRTGAGLSTDTALTTAGWAGMRTGPAVAAKAAHGHGVAVLAVAPDGTLVLSDQKQPANFSDGAEVPPDRLELLSPGSTAKVIRGPAPDTGTAAAAADAAHVAWVDVSRVDNDHSRWTIYVRDRRTGATRTVAQQTTTPVGPYALNLRLADGRVWWAAVRHPDDTAPLIREHPAIYSAAVDGTGRGRPAGRRSLAVQRRGHRPVLRLGA